MKTIYKGENNMEYEITITPPEFEEDQYSTPCRFYFDTIEEANVFIQTIMNNIANSNGVTCSISAIPKE